MVHHLIHPIPGSVMSEPSDLPETSLSQHFCAWAAHLEVSDIPPAVRAAATAALADFAGLCVAARDLDYVGQMARAGAEPGECTAIGHAAPMDVGGAALVNGTAAHGEDYDDTFEGTPVHTGAVIFPAVLAASERFGLSGGDAFRGIAAGTELMCRMALVAPTAIHRAGFHPTAVIGALGAAAAVGTALKLSEKQMTDALGIAGSMASGIIEYLAEGSWTKRMHAGWAAQAGIRAALLGREGFLGPRTVLEGQHGWFFAFADHGINPDFAAVTRDLGTRWHAASIAFKPYACGTMTQPFIDCAVRLAGDGLDPADIEAVTCKVGEGTVHRLWEPLSEKQAPSTAYSAKFSVPYCVAAGLLDGAAGLAQFTDERVADPAIRALAARITYEIDPANEYPANYSGHVRATLKDGSVREAEQPYMRGGAHEALDPAELSAKFRANCAFGGWDSDRIDALASFCAGLFGAEDLSGLAAFRG
jgi:2-methylcitrate dehydratase PrpD